MGRPRSELHTLLKSIPGPTEVYFQRPASAQIKAPYIVYERDYESTQHGNNYPYLRTKRYQITVIDQNPDSPIPDRIAALQMCVFDRFFVVNGLNHFVYKLFF